MTQLNCFGSKAFSARTAPRFASALTALGLVLMPSGMLADELGGSDAQLIAAADVPATYFGTVRAKDMHGLSYNVRGCIVAISEIAKRERVATSGEVLVELDDQQSQLTLKSAEARVLDLEAAIHERTLSVNNAKADERRRSEELAFVTKEFERNSAMFRRGLINEATMESVERRLLDANFALERSKEASANAESAAARAQIALEIGKLDKESAQVTHDKYVMTAPFDGALVGFDANVGDCIQDGALAAQIYAPDQKAVDFYVLISQLSSDPSNGVSMGATVNVTRVNGEKCAGTITRIETEADLENQHVQSTLELSQTCASDFFLNEAVKVETIVEPVESL